MYQKQILVLNILNETSKKSSFDNRIEEVFQSIYTPYDTIYLKDLNNFSNFNKYTHLLISGSTESAMEEIEWYTDLDAIIHHFDADKKSILGICFGHQFLVRHFLGKNHVRKSLTPEVGWAEISVSKNPIFKDIHFFKSAVFHFDEVFDLDGRFEIIANSDRCEIHGFQIKDKSIWGIQFHPDFLFQDVFTFAEESKEKVENFNEIYCQTSISKDEFRVNDLVIKNWIEIS